MTTTPTSTPASTPPEPPKSVLKTWKPTTAGILTIIAGALNVIVGIIIDALGIERIARGFMPVRLEAIGSVILIFGIVSIVGGVFAQRRRVWGLALAGAILALFPPPVIVLGILSIIFLAISKGEFNEKSKT